jgi:hypothetical protein
LQNINVGTVTESLTLSAAKLTTTLPDDGQIAEILLEPADVLKIKALTSMATDATDTFISMTNGVVNDLGGLPATTTPFEPIPNKNEPLPNTGLALPALGCTVYTKDSSSPQLLTFENYDPTEGKIELIFDEPVDITTISYGALTMQATKDGTAGQARTLAVDGTVEYKDDQKMTIVITLDIADKDAIQVQFFFSGRNLHSRMPLDPTHVRLKRTRV